MLSVRTLIRQWQQRALERRVAAQFTDRGLWDLALSRGDVTRALSQPFWRGPAVPSLWRVRPSARADVIISGDPASASARM